MSKKCYIFGAHSRGQTVKEYLSVLYPNLQILGYLVDNDETNPDQLGGVPVYHLSDNNLYDLAAEVYLGTKGIYHKQIIEHLQEIGFQTMIPITPSFDMELRNQYVSRIFESQNRKFEKIDDKTYDEKVSCSKRGTIYVASSAFDGKLMDSYEYLKEEKKLQVGSALTEERIADCTFFDDMGDHISDFNKQFCELTGLYWIWKHSEEDYVGLVHYRRHFLLPKDWIQIMEQNQIDVILPVPLYVEPSIAENYKMRHETSDWEFMMSFLKNYDYDMYGYAIRFFDSALYCPCNMLIARKEILDDFCEWLFPILMAVVEHGGQKTDSYQNRYPGFLSERLLTLFMDRNREKYHIVYADKNFLR